MGNRTTIQDIADEAGVSKATVSYILNNKPGRSISPATRAAVLAAAKKLQYFPSHSARALSGGSAGCIAVVVMGEKLKNYRFAGILSGLRSALAREGLDNVLLCSGRMRGNIQTIFPIIWKAGWMESYLSEQPIMSRMKKVLRLSGSGESRL